jgi:anaerobic selenocysteine-containing dehydrogenase
MSRFSRRELLGGAALAGAAALGCGQKKDPYRIDKPAVPGSRGRPGEERWVLSTCALCEAGCGVKVRVVEGRAVKIEGNPEHPVNRGGLCSRGQAALQLLYHPERVRSPLRRVGARGEGKWKPISWDEAISEVVAKLGKLRAAGHPERLVLIDGEPRGFTGELWIRLLSAFGSPNHIGLGSVRAAGVKLATLYTQGRYGLPAYDLDRTRFVLAMGAELLESSGQAMHFMRAAGAPREDGRGRHLRVTCVSPRRPGCRCDEWIAIAPGSYGALALSLAHVLVRDGLVDKDFVRDRVSGFSAWRDQAGVDQPGFEELVRTAYSPDKTKEVTGIPTATVERLAHALAGEWPAVVASDASAAAGSNGLATATAIFALNALLGNLERPGGVLLQRDADLSEWQAPAIDAVAAAGSAAPRIDGVGTAACPLGRSRVQAVAAAITQAEPYPVEALLLHSPDLLASLPGSRAWAAASNRVPFVMSFSSWLDEPAWLADLVLPEPCFLENWDVVSAAPAAGESVLGLRQPVVAPLHDTRSAGDIIVSLAAGLGGSVAQSLPWKSYQEAVAARLQGLLNSSQEGEAPEDVKSLLADMKEKGGWWREPAKAGARTGAFPTPSHKFEICSQMIALRMGEMSQAWPCRGLPPWEPPRFAGDPLQFPLQLVPYRPMQFVEKGMAFLPWLNELPLVSGDPWPVRAEINPADAARSGVTDGDRVLVASRIGSCEAIAQVSDGVRAGVVAMALGKGGVVDLVVPDEDRWSGAIAWQGTRVRVRKVS